MLDTWWRTSRDRRAGSAWRTGGGSEAGRECERLRRNDLADVELDERVRGEFDRARVAGEPLAVEERRHVPGGAANLSGAQRLPPYVEELPERVDAPDRRFDMDDTRGVMGVQPVQALAALDEAATTCCGPGIPIPAGTALLAPEA